MFSISASIAEFEIELRKERQLDGIAKENGVHFGRKAKLADDQIEEMQSKRAGGVLIRELMSE